MKIWGNAGRINDFKSITKVLKGNEDIKIRDLYKKITRNLMDGEAGSVFEDIVFLRRSKRSCRVEVENQTSYTIRCIGKAILGKQGYTHDNKIQSKQQKSYFFKKSNFSLKGCAGILTFTVKIPKSSPLCFLVAFRNYTVQTRKQSSNKVAILRINDSRIKPDVRFFYELMKNEELHPSFDECCYSSNNDPTFEATIAHETPDFTIKFDNIEITVSMTTSFQSQVFVTISNKKDLEITEKDTKRLLIASHP